MNSPCFCLRQIETNVDKLISFSQQLQPCNDHQWPDYLRLGCVHGFSSLKEMLAVFKEMLAKPIELSQQIAKPILVMVCEDSGHCKSKVPLESPQSYTKHIKTPQFLRRGPSFLTLISCDEDCFLSDKDCKKSSETNSLGQLGSFDPRVDPRSSQSFHNLTLPAFLLETISHSTSRLISWDLGIMFGQACSHTHATRSLGQYPWVKRGSIGPIFREHPSG